MTSSLLLAIIIASGMLFSSALLPFQLNGIYADESETNTEQELAQENLGSGDSVNNNCAQNTIDSDNAILACGGSGETTPTPPPPPNQAFTANSPFCSHPPIPTPAPTVICRAGD